MRCSIILLMLVLVVSGSAFSAETKKGVIKEPVKTAKTAASITQGEFARRVVKLLGWEKGLPKEPKDRDYLLIMEGKRSFKFEAENAYNRKTDDVAVRKYELFGPFSGISWLGGISTPTTVHFKVFIPISGEYRLSAAAKGKGQRWKIGGKEFTVNSGDRLTVTDVATVALKAGETEFEMELPPEGGVDYLLFSAPDLTPIEPLDGWRFSSPLTKGDLAAIVASLLGWEDRLPVDAKSGVTTILGTDLQGLPPTVTATDTGYYGKFTAQRWLRAGNTGAELDVPFTVSRTGVYGLKLRYMGALLKASLDGTALDRDAKGILDWINLGPQRLSEGKHLLHVSLPSYGGLDALVIEPRQSSPADYMALVGLKGEPADVVTPAEAEKIETQLVERFTGRK